jgi:hypothetical protein
MILDNMPLNAEQRKARYRKLQRWFKGVATEVEWLVQSGTTFSDLQTLASASPRLQQVGINWANHWIAANFGIATAVRARSIIDRDRRTTSLVRVLEEMEAHPEVFSRNRFIRQFVHHGRSVEEANQAFDALAGGRRQGIDPQRVKRDRERLARQLKRLRWYVNKRAAHLERGWSRRKATLGTVVRAVKALEAVTKRYYPIFMGEPASPWFGVHRSNEWREFFAADVLNPPRRRTAHTVFAPTST